MRYNMIRLFRIKAGAHRIALGFVVGFFPCWFPTFGVGPVLSVALTRWIKGNVVAAIVAASVGSFLWPFLFYLNYMSGKLITDNWSRTPDPDEDYATTAEQVISLSDLGMDFIVGSLMNSIILTVVGYWLLRAIFTHYRPHIYRWIKKTTLKKRRRAKQN
ncbi:DUF2062 domain-containing protein [Xylanibacillus composti]|nr:DUF2062 domain-containing protein [Xylanibacillus composti]